MKNLYRVALKRLKSLISENYNSLSVYRVDTTKRKWEYKREILILTGISVKKKRRLWNLKSLMN